MFREPKPVHLPRHLEDYAGRFLISRFGVPSRRLRTCCPSAVKPMVPVRNRFGLALLVLPILIPMLRVGWTCGSRLGFPDMGPVIIQSIQEPYVPTRRRRLACRAVVPIKRSARIVGAGRWVHCCRSNTSVCGQDVVGRGIVGTRTTVIGGEPAAPLRRTTRHTGKCIHPNC